ncbi:MAG: zinc ribbon domain-containing protein [Muribaculaceae bacterium]|nr:zinc ribbon domain-containing protein [Muribaculaceae bacterium]
MELQCPQCAKVMQVSAEEVALHGGVVVCPQCLATFDASEMVPAGTEARRIAVRVIDEHLTYSFCPHCGQRIPQGVNFCPYCGKSLKHIPGETIPQPEPPQSSSQHTAADQPATTDKARTDERRSSHRRHSTSSSNKKWNPILPTYRYAGAKRKERQKASLPFTIGALLVIAAQLALLAFIIYKVSLFN